MSPTWTTFLFEAGNFLVLAAFLGWLFFKPVRKALADQRAKNEAATNEAEQKLAEAERLRNEIDTEHKKLQEELNQLRSKELEAARKQAEQIVSDARAARERERENLKRQATRLAENEERMLSQAAAAAAARAVGKLLEQIRGPDLDSALFQAAWQQLQSFSGEKLAPVKVESARALSPAQQKQLEEFFGEDAAGKTSFHVVDELGAGLRITTARGLIDATSTGLAQYAQQALATELNGAKK